MAALALAVPAAGGAAGPEGPPERPDTKIVMFVGNNWGGTADIIDVDTYETLHRFNTVPDREERMAEIMSDPYRLGFFLGIREAVGEGHDQLVDDMFTTHDGTIVAISRPSFADVVGMRLDTFEIVWRFPMEGVRSDHMGVSPDGTKLLVSDSTGNKVHELNIVTGEKTGEFESGDSPHENNYSGDGSRIWHASIGRVYTPGDSSELGVVRDTTKGARYFQVVDGNTLEIISRVDMGEKLDEAGYPDMSAAVRPMAISPDEKTAYLQVSFHHGFVEYDLEQEKVLRVADLPISEEARNTPREQYLLDSAHHGLAMNEEGTKLCVAGTMSDYAAITQRDSFETKIVHNGSKPYWSTNGPNGDCWISFSGDDNVAVVDYDTEERVALVPVGFHPQRVRIGAVRRDYLAQLSGEAGQEESAPAEETSQDDATLGGEDTVDTITAEEEPVSDFAAGTAGTVSGDGSLAFTGLDLGALALFGGALLAGGVLLRRRLADG